VEERIAKRDSYRLRATKYRGQEKGKRGKLGAFARGDGRGHAILEFWEQKNFVNHFHYHT